MRAVGGHRRVGGGYCADEGGGVGAALASSGGAG
jgi:hypothetical protein